MTTVQDRDPISSPAGETILAPLGAGRAAAEARMTTAWLLACSGFLVVGCCIAAAAALLGLHPGLASWGAAFLDPKNAAVSALLLVAAGAWAALARGWSSMGWRRPAAVALAAAVLLGGGFLALRYHESVGLFDRGLAFGEAFKPVLPEETAGGAWKPLVPAAAEDVAGEDGSTLLPPAPAPAGLAEAGETGAGHGVRPTPRAAGVYFGLVHLLGLVAFLLVLAAAGSSLPAILRLVLGRDRPGVGESVGVGVVVLWQLGMVSWVFTVALLHVAG